MRGIWSPVLASLLLAGGGAALQQAEPPGQTVAAEPANEFDRQNPGYRERAGAYYEKEYLGPAVEQLAAAIGVDDSRRPALREELRAFISDWLDAYVRGGGRMDAASQLEVLARMDERFRRVLDGDDLARYWLWRIGETNGNALAFLIQYRPERQWPDGAAEGNAARLAAVDQLARSETVAATIELMAVVDTDDAVVLLHAARALSDRLPPPDYPGRGCPFTDLRRDQVRRNLAATAWDPALAPELRALARQLLARQSMDEAGVGALMLTCVGQVEDLPTVTGAMTRFLDSTANPEVAPAPMSGSFDPLMMASQGLLYLGARPAPDPKTSGELAVYLGALLALPESRPEGWRERCRAWQDHPIPLVRYMAGLALGGK